MGTGSLDELVSSMIRLMDAHQQELKETGWYIDERGERSDARTGKASV